MSTALIVNPAAGHGRADRMAHRVRQAAERVWGEVTLAMTREPGHAAALAEEAGLAGADRIIVVGGDGTVHEAANGILRLATDRRPALAVIPAGTGNDFAKLVRTLGHAPERAIALLARGPLRRLDVGQAWGEYFLNSIGIGFDAAVALEVNRSSWGRGIPAYLVAVGKVVRHFQPFDAVVSADDVAFRDRLLLIEVGNGPVVGGGFRITPTAVPDDGIFDICAVQSLSVFGIVRKLPLVMLGKHLGLKEVRSFRSRRISIRRLDGPLEAQLDGEVRIRDEELEIRLEPASLPVLVAR